MQVDVDVYKGPLAKEPIIQWAELRGILDEGRAGMAGMVETNSSLTRRLSIRLSKDRELLSELSTVGSEDPCLKGLMLYGSGPYSDSAALAYAAECRSKNNVDMTRTLLDPTFKNLDTKTPTDYLSGAELRYLATNSGQNTQTPENEDMASEQVFYVLRSVAINSKAFNLRCDSLLKNRFASKFKTCETMNAINHASITALTELGRLNRRMARCHSKVVDAQNESTKQSEKFERESRDCVMESLTEAARLGTRLQQDAFLNASSQVPYAQSKSDVRRLYVGFSNLAAEIGNQLQSRSDILLKQMRGDDRRLLPISQLLRDASPTRYLDLYIWNRAGSPGDSDERTRERVRAIEKLWADNYWQRINRVQASGFGKNRMAFIKDDIGNWSLKSFANDPGDALKAFSDITKSTVGAVAEVMLGGPKAAGIDFSKAEQGLQFVQRTAFGISPSEAAVEDSKTAQAIKDRAVNQMKALRTELNDQRTKMDTGIKEAGEKITSEEAALKLADDKIAALALSSTDPAVLKQKLHAAEGAKAEADRVLAAETAAGTTDLTKFQARVTATTAEVAAAKLEVDKREANADVFKTKSTHETAIAKAKAEKTKLESAKSELAKTARDRSRTILDSAGGLMDEIEALSLTQSD